MGISALLVALEQIEVFPVGEDPIAATPRDLANDSQLLEPAERADHGRRRQMRRLGQRAHRGERPGFEREMHPKYGACPSAETLNASSITREELGRRLRHRNGGLSRVRDRVREKREPTLPIAAGSHVIERFVVAAPVAFEIQAQVEKRLAQDVFGAENQGDEQSSDPTVAVEKWMDRLELNMRERRFDERRGPLRPIVDKTLERGHAIRDAVGRRWNVMRVPWARATDPIL